MAKKNQGSSSDQIILFVVALIGAIALWVARIALHLLPVLIPCYIIIMGLIAWYQYRKVDKPFVDKKFHLSNGEMGLLHEYNEKIGIALDKIKECERIVVEEHLHINKDGRISSKSYRGVEVQGALDHANQTINDLKPKSDYLISLPGIRYKKALRDYVRLKGFEYAIIITIVASIPCYFTDFRQELVGIVGDLTGKITFFESSEILPIIWYCSSIMLCTYVLCRLIARIYFSIKNKKPKC